jgi:hypothetical protein
VELVIKELKGGLHLGRMQVSQEANRVERSGVLPVCAYWLLLHLHGRDQALSQGSSLFQLQQRLTEGLMQDQVNRVEQKWRRKYNEIKAAA